MHQCHCLPKRKENEKKQHQKERPILHQDKPSSHTKNYINFGEFGVRRRRGTGARWSQSRGGSPSGRARGLRRRGNNRRASPCRSKLRRSRTRRRTRWRLEVEEPPSHRSFPAPPRVVFPWHWQCHRRSTSLQVQTSSPSATTVDPCLIPRIEY